MACQALLDATECVLRSEGYGAVTSRRVAQEAGVKQQLLFYYFHSMEDMLLAAFRRRTQRGLERLDKDLASQRPMRALLADYTQAVDAKLSFEYMALANHHAGVREEIAAFMNKARRLQADGIAKVFRARKIKPSPVTPAAAAFLLGSITLLLGREEATGITVGHRDVKALLAWFLEKIE